MISQFPHTYVADLEWKTGRQGVVSAPVGLPFEGGPPPEFGGSSEWWSPEHLLLSAANLCLMTTFMSMAEKKGLKVLGYQSRADGVLDKTAQGLAFARIGIKVSLRVDGPDVERARELLATAKKYCIVSNALKTPVELEASVTPQPLPAAAKMP